MHVTPRAAQPADQGVEPFGFRLRQAAGRLVEHDEPRAAPDRRGDLQHLLLADAQRPTRAGRRRSRAPIAREHRSRALRAFRRATTNPARAAARRGRDSRRPTGSRRTPAPGAPSPTPARERVARAARSGRAGRRWRCRPLVRRDDAGEDLPERALAGAVLAAQRVAACPARISNETSSSATTPGKRFMMCVERTTSAARRRRRLSSQLLGSRRLSNSSERRPEAALRSPQVSSAYSCSDTPPARP